MLLKDINLILLNLCLVSTLLALTGSLQILLVSTPFFPLYIQVLFLVFSLLISKTNNENINDIYSCYYEKIQQSSLVLIGFLRPSVYLHYREFLQSYL